LLSLGRNKQGIRTCLMHTQELVVTHALGIRTRSTGNEVHDSFVEGKHIRSRVKKLLSFVMDRKSKGRFREYQEFCKDHCGTQGLVLELPNDTRVAGTYRMFLSCIRSKKALQGFGSHSSHASSMIDMNLSMREWIVLSEFESVLKECNDLAMQSQLDMVGANSFSYYAVQKTRHFLNKAKTFDFIEVKNQYSPSVPREELVKTRYEREAMSAEAQTLLKRLENEFNNYFGKPDDDQILQMFFHPYIVWNGYT
jgi:hypothetical protein